MTDRVEYIAGLRKLADWLEQNPDVDIPTYNTDIALPVHTNANVEDFARAAGVEVVVGEKGNTRAAVTFGPIDYYAYGYTDFDADVAETKAENARTWAAEQGLTLQPREGGDA
ncbi:hypothetical protein ACFWCA_32560 [Streptomyces phaeochromogenes]|uniref:hypothetical protein n=1 Tax=Streptomyces phaeochromogenes TaxID=1923 RepID=UPI0036A8CF79